VTEEERLGRAKGRRAEEVAEWYFRLNGFLSIHSFIVHIDKSDPVILPDGTEVGARTEADLMGVRFPNSREVLNNHPMEDASWITQPPEHVGKPLFILVEVKASTCKMNGPWTDPRKANMQRVIRRLGFASSEPEVDEIAASMYRHARWVGSQAVIQYVCVGDEQNSALSERFGSLVQLAWADIGSFLFHRFKDFPEKLPGGLIHHQWPRFGKEYAKWFYPRYQSGSTEADSITAIKLFVESGRWLPLRTGRQV
jgi:hypothetical protein